MGNKLSACSCGPLIRKAYPYEDSPWQVTRRRDGHLLRLWAEVFHVSASGAGSVKWQQISEDLVPVNITCIQDTPECVFHITAYNSQVDKILDVRIIQPGTRIGQASECFLYWKDPLSSDTWGLNFTSSIDAKQFKECCSPTFKFSRKASSSYSLRLDPPYKGQSGGSGKGKSGRRKTFSTPTSPRRDPQCTCMTPDQFARLRMHDPRFRGSATLPRLPQQRTDLGIATETDSCGVAKDVVVSSGSNTLPMPSTSRKLPQQHQQPQQQQQQQQQQSTTQDRETATPGGTVAVGPSAGSAAASQVNNTNVAGVSITNGIASQTDDMDSEVNSRNKVAGKTSTGTSTPKISAEYSEDPNIIINHIPGSSMYTRSCSRDGHASRTIKSDGMAVDSSTMSRLLKPMRSLESPVTSPEMGRRRYHYHPLNTLSTSSHGYYHHVSKNGTDGALSEPESHSRHKSRISASRSTHDMSRSFDRDYSSNRLYFERSTPRVRGLDSEPSEDPNLSSSIDFEDPNSPPSDNDLFVENTQCYATTPSSSSNGNSSSEFETSTTTTTTLAGVGARLNVDTETTNGPTTSSPSSPTSRLLLEYEMHLRNTLARGMDAESISLHTFEALLSQSMEDLEFAEKLPISSRSPHVHRRRSTGAGTVGLGSRSSSTLPHRMSLERASSMSNREKEGYYSDRNEAVRERHQKDRGYQSDREQRDRGYFSDFSSNRCNSCLSDSARSNWFRHSDGWRSGTSTLSSFSSSGMPTYGFSSSFQSESAPLSTKRAAWESLPSLRHENSMYDGVSKLARSDSLERRALRDRHDPFRYDGMLSHQTSFESTDSKLCYLTSSEMSDDDRMSLTTAISDDEDLEEGSLNSPYNRSRKANSASFNCTGAVRKAGFLSVKKWLLRKKKQIELARKRGWKGYWVCLKGTTLLFYPCDSKERHCPDVAPKHLIIVDGSIMQPIPEHPKRDYIFCLSTAFGDAYLFQAPCQVELENWINSIHAACAAAFARHRGKTGTFHLLSEEIFKVEKALDANYKSKQLIELQLSLKPEFRESCFAQMAQADEEMERLHCEQFRLRCYMSSLQNGELPNPKNLLANVSRPTKLALNKLSVFTVSSFHAYICAKSPTLLNKLLVSRTAAKRRTSMLSRSNSASSRRSLSLSSRDEERTIKVNLPDNQTVQIYLKDGMTVEEYIASACSRKSLNPTQHFVRVKKRRDMEDHNYFVPHRSDLVETYLNTHEVVEICVKVLYQVQLVRSNLDHMWGFSVEAELSENADRQDELCVWVSRVEDKGVAVQNGIIKGDEILVINSSIVSDLDMMFIESVLQEEYCLCMMMRSSRIEPPTTATPIIATNDDIESLVCPPPPTDPPVISEEMISGLIVPAPQSKEQKSGNPGWTKQVSESSIAATTQKEKRAVAATQGDSQKQPTRASSLEIENLVKSAGEVTGFCRSPVDTNGRNSPTESIVSSQSLMQTNVPTRILTDAEKLRKVILELIETERMYVMYLSNLLEDYLEPLKHETFLTTAEISVLFGNTVEIISFQKQFLNNLNEALQAETDFYHFESPSQFKNILFSIASAFLYYIDHFKLYSSFCASHSKAQKILNPTEGNYALQEFLAARNPQQQHSSTFESYLIKPIQRIVKYPLLLQQLRNHCEPNSDEFLHLVDALKGMEKVAEHINEMQRIHEEYGAIFDHLFRQHQKPIDLSPGDLLYYGGVEWINIADFIGKIKKGLELNAMCFVFKSAVVFLCKERIRQKKKIIGVTTNKPGGDVEVIRYQVLIPVTDVLVRTVQNDQHFLWELVHMRCHPQRRSERVYLLANSSNDYRNAFIRTIRQTIRESVRNMHIPNKTPPQQQKLIKPPPFYLAGDKSEHGRKLQKPQEVQQKSVCTQQEQSSVPAQQETASSQTSGKPKKIPPKPPQRRTSTISTEQSVERNENRMSKQMDVDVGMKSEEDDSQCSTIREKIPKTAIFGKTPNHLTLSSTSTLSTGSQGSQARLIQSSQHPENYQPPVVKDLGSPVWKPMDKMESLTLPRKNKASTTVDTRTLVRKPNLKIEPEQSAHPKS